MTDSQIFNEVFDRLNKLRCNRLGMKGTMVCWNGVEKFNTDDYSLGYNLYRLTKLLKDNGIFE